MSDRNEIFILRNEVTRLRREIASYKAEAELLKVRIDRAQEATTLYQGLFYKTHRALVRMAKWRDLCLAEIDDWKRIARELAKG